MNAMATYKEIAIRLAKDGFDVLCFSNGAAEDQMAMSMLAEQLQSSAEWGRHISFAQRPRDPRDLAQLIADLDIVIAHRLHAAIVAFSYGVPAIGLRWDSKLDAFFESVHRSRYLADFDEAIVKTITSRVQVTLAEPNCEELRAQVMKEAYDGIKTLTEALLKAHQNSRTLADNSATR
jgi:polysaccharide pyruvyl transferase WcaK-like protein